MRRIVVSAIALAALAACGDRPAPDLERSQLLLDDRAVTDTVETHLIALQRAFISALQHPDSAALVTLIAADFRAYDTRSSRTGAISLGRGERPAELSYIEVLAGNLAGTIDGPFDSFHVTHDDAQAIVYAIGVQMAVRTVWRRTRRGWQATQLIAVSPGAAQRMIDDQ